ncbi:MAG TPA: BamA/TamA family outer membrane protein [Nitrospira sp.]|nr:BamA/TamA family outer membrane protein [Nitrospira sp.]
MRIPAALSLCLVLLVSGTSIGQELITVERPGDSAPKVPPSTDVPVQETESERAELKQAEAKEEALKSLAGKEGYTAIPLPAFSYNRNEGYWAGALMPILKSNAKGELTDIYAPQYLHNPSIGETFSVNYFGYPSDTEQYSAVASYSTKIQRDIDLNYKNVAAGGGRYILAVQATWFKNAFRRFFGIGNQASEHAETNYTSRETLIQLTAGINLSSDLALLWSERYHDVRVEEGAVTSLPQTKTLFPDLIGLEGAQVFGHKLAVRYDTRDKQLVTTSGTYVIGAIELNQNLERREPNRWWRTTFDARQFIPHYNDRMVFVARFLADAVNGKKTPFYERPTLGGETTLRAFGQNRFVDDTLILVNFEERVRFRRQNIFDHELDLEVAPFVDIGRVMGHFSFGKLTNPQVNPGVGFRVISQPNVVGRLDIGYGKDGANVFVGLDYPF